MGSLISWTAVTDLFTGVPVDGPAHVTPPATPAADPSPSPSPFRARLSTQLAAHPARLVLACLASVLGPAMAAQAGSLPSRPAVAAADSGPVAEPVPEAIVPTPQPGDTASWMVAARVAASTCPGLPSAVLVAIGQVETGLGVRVDTSPAGARGPMQFLPATWAAYGADGNHDGVADVTDPADAVQGAARLLCANGGADPGRLPAALWDYNHSDAYVRQVLAAARGMTAG